MAEAGVMSPKPMVVGTTKLKSRKEGCIQTQQQFQHKFKMAARRDFIRTSGIALASMRDRNRPEQRDLSTAVGAGDVTIQFVLE